MTQFPNSKTFAFTIFDDTDLSTVENVQPVYRLLDELGFRTTKSVWPLASQPQGRYGGQSLQDAEYLRFIKELHQRGFEIALHGVRNTHATRQEIHHGIEEFIRLLGAKPRVHANHSTNIDNIYWGAARFSLLKSAYQLSAAFRPGRDFSGHNSASPYFWGDLCRANIDYVRNFVFCDINVAGINPSMPYHDPSKPWVNAWFSSSDGADVDRFCSLLSEENQDRLEEQRGICIVYTHFACGFVERGRVKPRVAELLRRVSQKGGWFVPVSNLLDFCRLQRGTLAIPRRELWTMELRWAIDRLSSAMSRKPVRDPSIIAHEELSSVSA